MLALPSSILRCRNWRGRYKGRVPTAWRQAAEVARLKAAGLRPMEIANRLGIGRASVYPVLGEPSEWWRLGGGLSGW